MAGLTNLLNIGKVGLLAQQTSLQTIGHNISNVNTPGYSRQNVELSAKDPTPTFIGPMGNGVDATDIVRAYDRFITQTLFGKTSDMSGLEARVSGMQIIEGTLNEVEENGINGLLESFWNGWDDLANNAEGMAERTTLLQRASALAEALRDKYTALAKLSKNIDLNIDSTIGDINQLTGQIAELNVQIVAAEAGHHSANDLRDQRDQLVNRLSQLANIHYFETERGSYTVLIGQGSPLVEDDRAWHLEMRDGSVNWLGSNGQKFELTTRDISSGELGGWLDIKKRLEPRDPTELVGSAVNTTGGKAVKLATLWSDVDGVTVTGGFNIAVSGTDRDGAPVSGTYDSTVDVDGDGTAGTIGDFASYIENLYAGDVQVTITSDGRLKIEDINPGDEPISFQIEDISGGITGLDLGKFDGSYPLSYIEELNQIGKQLIKYVNGQHSQGVGLIPLQEATANNAVENLAQPLAQRSSGLEFSGEIQNGSFDIWLYDESGNPVDQDAGTSAVNDPVKITIDGSTTLNSLINDINAISGIRATSLDGRLVISVDGTNNNVASFAFGNDTSNVLMALGINSFFTGSDASTIDINQDLIHDPRLVAAARIEGPGAPSASSVPVVEPERPLGLHIGDGNAGITISGPGGSIVHTIPVHNNTGQVDSLDDILASIQSLDGIERAWVQDGRVHIEAETGFEITGLSDPGSTNLWTYLGMSVTTPSEQVSGGFNVDRTFDGIDTLDTGVSNGILSIMLYDENGVPLDADPTTPAVTDPVQININTGDSLSDIRTAIDSQPNLRAVIEDGKLQIYAAGEAASFAFTDDTSGLMDYLNLYTPAGGGLNPANNMNALALRDLNRKPVEDLDDATLSQAYQGLVGKVGIHTRTFKLDLDFTKGAVSDLRAKREDVSGVSIDEELSNLLKFQHAYTAAAKLIKAADEMFLSLLNAK